MACPMRPPGGLPAREAGASERQPPKLDTWPRTLRAAAILANQFGTRCDRLLLVHDNLGGAGLGWSSNYWSIALAAAVQAGRVLHAVPSPSSANSSLATRWCDRPPFTLECKGGYGPLFSFLFSPQKIDFLPSHRLPPPVRVSMAFQIGPGAKARVVHLWGTCRWHLVRRASS